MKYKFDYQTTTYDLWRLAMYNTYNSMVGVSNIIFIIAMILLTIKFWNSVGLYLKILLLFGILLFTVIQPTVVYLRAKKQVSTIPKDMEIYFDNYGVHVITKNEKSDLKWSMIKGISKAPGMLVIHSSTKHGFILTNKVLGKEREEFFKYVVSKTK